MQILGYHRVVRDLAGQSPDAVLAALRARMTRGRSARGITRRPARPDVLDGRWHVLTPPQAPAGVSRADALDVEMLERDVLRPVFDRRHPHGQAHRLRRRRAEPPNWSGVFGRAMPPRHSPCIPSMSRIY